MSKAITRKRCSRCKKLLDRSEFYRDRIRKDGLRYWCKECCKRWEQSPARKAIQKRYNQSPAGKATQKRFWQSPAGKAATKRSNQSPVGRASKNRWSRNQRLKFSDRFKARDTVNNAVKAGKLSKPTTLECVYCDNPAEQYHHYAGYDASIRQQEPKGL